VSCCATLARRERTRAVAPDIITPNGVLLQQSAGIDAVSMA
jgi:hypothetical protein